MHGLTVAPAWHNRNFGQNQNRKRPTFPEEGDSMSIAISARRRRRARHTGQRPVTIRGVAVALTLWVGAIALGSPVHLAEDRQGPADVLIIGAGISGLSAALEAARGGASVLVIDMSTVGGGHAILSNGAVCIVDTPLQQRQKVVDSPALAEKDFLARGEDNDIRWVAAYVRDSREWLYDWLTDLGVSFEALTRPAGNSVARLHMTRGKGLGLVEPIYRACLRHSHIRFQWASMAEDLVIRSGRVTGVRVRNLRRGTREDLLARNVIVATGGFQGNLKTALANWPSELPKPGRLLVGAAHSATGSGHDLVRRANGTVSRLDHQWNYVLGLTDPRDPTRTRGLAAFNFNAIWVNADGKRFTQEFGDELLGLRTLLNQPGGMYWSVFDEKGKDGFTITLAGYENLGDVRRLVYDTPGIVLKADSLDALAVAMRVPPRNLRATVSRYNELTKQGIDLDFHAFGEKTLPKPKPIDTPPFYAAQFFPLTRKSMGGVDVDLDCRVLSKTGRAIPGLFAVGEVTGFGGINGKAALEGTFLGPGIYMGRIAGRRIAQDLGRRRPPDEKTPTTIVSAPTDFSNSECLKCHDVAKDSKQQRPGYWHYEQSHAKALSRQYACASCHSDLSPYRAGSHRLDRGLIVAYCRACHGVQPREGPPARPGEKQ
jgi:predicted oxidoreductase